MSRVTPQQWAEILEAHRRWVESKGREGKKCEFHEEDPLQNPELPKANLHKANLQRANLQRANLRGANLTEADLTEAQLRDADLRDADLTQVKGLLGKQLGGADLTRTKLPENIARFEGLKNIEELSKNAGKLFVSLLLACAFMQLTIARTQDVQLLTNSGMVRLPIIDADVSVTLFYWLTPAVVLVLFFFFHLYLQHIWEAMAELPAVFPDGTTVDRKTYPWLLNDLVRSHLYQLRKTHRLLNFFQGMLFTLLAYALIPLTLLPCWVRYLCRHDWTVTWVHIVLLTVSLWAALVFLCLAVVTLRGKALFWWLEPFTSRRTILFLLCTAAALGCGVFFYRVSAGAIAGAPPELYDDKSAWTKAPFLPPGDLRRWAPRILGKIGYSPFANFDEVEVSAKPEKWTGSKEDEIKAVRGARLKEGHLEYARASHAFLVNADLRAADLRGANLDHADLQGAHLDYADLHQASLNYAKIRGAILINTGLQGAQLFTADLRGAQLIFTNLRGADLHHANLEGADLHYAVLQGADLFDANLHKASLNNADLHGAQLFYAKLQGVDLSDARLQGTNLGIADLRGASLNGAHLEGADLHNANLQEADLHGALYDDKTQWPTGLDPKKRGARYKARPGS